MHARKTAEALWLGKCPRCHEGDIFAHSITSHPFRFNKMNETCPHCGVRLEPEPGFYQGAMYVSYGFTVVCLVAVSIALYLLGDFSEWVYIGIIVGIMILAVPLNYRYSRIIFLYLFGGIKFDASRV